MNSKKKLKLTQFYIISILVLVVRGIVEHNYALSEAEMELVTQLVKLVLKSLFKIIRMYKRNRQKAKAVK
jgi:hypothetical protein